MTYVGRNSRGWLGSPWRNFFSHLPNSTAIYKTATVREAIEAYEQFLFACLEGRKQYHCVLFGKVLKMDTYRKKDQIEEFFSSFTGEENIGCWCVNCDNLPPRGQDICHGQTIWRAWEWWRKQS